MAFLGQQSHDLMFLYGQSRLADPPGPGVRDRLATALREGATIVVSPRKAVTVLPSEMLATPPAADSAELVAFRIARSATASTTGTDEAAKLVR